MTTKHTPGPWRLETIESHGTIEAIGVRDSYGLFVAMVEPHDMAHADALANGRLIAAAPDLLAALQHIKDNLMPAAGAKHVREYIVTFCADAIAKATSEG